MYLSFNKILILYPVGIGISDFIYICITQINFYEAVQKVFGTLDLFVSLLEAEIKYPILQGDVLTFWTAS